MMNTTNIDREYAEDIAKSIGESIAEDRGTANVQPWVVSFAHWSEAVDIMGRAEALRVARAAAARVMAEKEGF